LSLSHFVASDMTRFVTYPHPSSLFTCILLTYLPVSFQPSSSALALSSMLDYSLAFPTLIPPSLLCRAGRVDSPFTFPVS
jgi:hypothetical protein